MSGRILIIDDDERLSAMLVTYLGERGLAAEARPDGPAGLTALRGGGFDAVVLDVMMPGPDGFEVCRRIRAFSTVPVLMLTARGDELDRIVGLELGADDYLPKPFNPRELLARLQAVLRRTRAESPAVAEVLRFGALEIDRAARVVRKQGQPVKLTGHQLELLWALASQAGRVLSRDQLMQAVTGDTLEAFDRSIDVHVSRIRAAIEDDPRQPRWLHTVRGTGYVFAAEQDRG